MKQLSTEVLTVESMHAAAQITAALLPRLDLATLTEADPETLRKLGAAATELFFGVGDPLIVRLVGGTAQPLPKGE